MGVPRGKLKPTLDTLDFCDNCCIDRTVSREPRMFTPGCRLRTVVADTDLFSGVPGMSYVLLVSKVWYEFAVVHEEDAQCGTLD